MTTGRIVELVAALVILAAGIWLYRARRTADRSYGSQGAVLLFAIAAILAIHALGGLEYRPSESELEAIRQ
jgi:glycerol-3-phosphate dehydrogenase